MKLFYFMTGWLLGGWTPLWWLIKRACGLVDKDVYRTAACFGLKDEWMVEHWDRYYESRGMHELINVITEWTRLDAQRAQKVFSFLAQVGAILTGVTTWLILVIT